MANWSKKTIAEKLGNLYISMLGRGIVIGRLDLFWVIARDLGMSEKYLRKYIDEARNRYKRNRLGPQGNIDQERKRP